MATPDNNEYVAETPITVKMWATIEDYMTNIPQLLIALGYPLDTDWDQIFIYLHGSGYTAEDLVGDLLNTGNKKAGKILEALID